MRASRRTALACWGSLSSVRRVWSFALTSSQSAHSRTPIAEGGERFSFDNMTSYCAEHHQLKSTADALRGKRRLRVTTNPP